MREFKPIIVLLLLLISSCANNNRQANGNTGSPNEQRASFFGADTFYLCNWLVKIDTITQTMFGEITNDFNDTTGARKNREFVKRAGDTMTIITAQKVSRLIDIKADNDSAASYSYRYFDPNINQHVILATFYEWPYYILIDKNTGDTTNTCGMPVISPDKRYFICGNTDLEAGETFNGFELYENTSPPKLLCERRLEKWGPQTINNKPPSKILK